MQNGLVAARTPTDVALQRAEQMAARYRSGATLQQIGERYGITRERVRQVMTWHLGITAKDGGAAKRAEMRDAARLARRDARYIAKHGMTFATYWEINNGFDSKHESPAAKFRMQLANANRRGIAWRLTFAEWWRIWQASGKWNERRRGSGYCMSRYGDRGAYEVGNVCVTKAQENSSEYINRYWREVRAGVRPQPKPPKNTGTLYGTPLDGLEVGQRITLPIKTKRAVYAQNNAYATAKRRGWKVSATTKTGELVVTRIQ